MVDCIAAVWTHPDAFRRDFDPFLRLDEGDIEIHVAITQRLNAAGIALNDAGQGKLGRGRGVGGGVLLSILYSCCHAVVVGVVYCHYHHHTIDPTNRFVHTRHPRTSRSCDCASLVYSRLLVCKSILLLLVAR